MNNIDKTMKEKMKAELLELKNLEPSGSLSDEQKSRLTELLVWEREEADNTALLEKAKKDTDTALAQKEHFRTKFEKEEAARVAAEAKAKEGGSGTPAPLEVEDFINISASLDGLDTREKEYLANQHKLTGKPLGEIRQDENFLLWQTAYKQKVEKEKSALPPTNTQITENVPVSLEKKLEDPNLSMAEKEKLLTEAGLYISPKRKSDRVNIGTQR